MISFLPFRGGGREADGGAGAALRNIEYCRTGPSVLLIDSSAHQSRRFAASHLP